MPTIFPDCYRIRLANCKHFAHSYLQFIFLYGPFLDLCAIFILKLDVILCIIQAEYLFHIYINMNCLIFPEATMAPRKEKKSATIGRSFCIKLE